PIEKIEETHPDQRVQVSELVKHRVRHEANDQQAPADQHNEHHQFAQPAAGGSLKVTDSTGHEPCTKPQDEKNDECTDSDDDHRVEIDPGRLAEIIGIAH